MLHSKFWQPFFALAPIIIITTAIVGYVIFIFSMLGNLHGLEHNDVPPAEFLAGLGTFLIVIMLVVLLSMGSLIFYIMHAVQNPNLKENNLRLVWILLFVFVGGIGQLIYWITEILGKKRQMTLPN